MRPDRVRRDYKRIASHTVISTRRIRARPWANTVLIAALTGQYVDRRRAREAGVDLHFVKPVDTTALLGAVARSLNDGRRVDLP